MNTRLTVRGRVGLAVCVAFVLAAASADDFSLDWFTIAGGGSTWPAGDAYELGGAIAQPATETMSGAVFELTGGFWPVIGPAVGDLDCDGQIAFGDINAFVLALTNATAYYAQFPYCHRELADCNRDGYVDLTDINSFVALFQGKGMTPGLELLNGGVQKAVPAK